MRRAQEGRNQARLQKTLEPMSHRVHVPMPYLELSSRRVLVTEWVEGRRLAELPADEVAGMLELGKECFLRQLLQDGFMHLDPHPGNLLRLSDGRLALLDHGLMATIGEEERAAMVSAIVHTANRNWEKLVDDMTQLGVLPPDSDRKTVEPLMERVLSPYVFSGGGIANAVNSAEGGARGIASDLLTALREVPFTVPSYFALLGRAVATLEGIALRADPEFKLVMEACVHCIALSGSLHEEKLRSHTVSLFPVLPCSSGILLSQSNWQLRRTKASERRSSIFCTPKVAARP